MLILKSEAKPERSISKKWEKNWYRKDKEKQGLKRTKAGLLKRIENLNKKYQTTEYFTMQIACQISISDKTGAGSEETVFTGPGNTSDKPPIYDSKKLNLLRTRKNS